MKQLFIFLYLLSIVSCVDTPKSHVEKPFIIVDKEINHSNSTALLLIQDKNGKRWWIIEERETYKVGDTIK